MDPNQTCEVILNNIIRSNLNFTIIETQFTLTVTIKKTFNKNKDGKNRVSGLDTTFPKKEEISFPKQESLKQHKFQNNQDFPGLTTSQENPFLNSILNNYTNPVHHPAQDVTFLKQPRICGHENGIHWIF